MASRKNTKNVKEEVSDDDDEEEEEEDDDQQDDTEEEEEDDAQDAPEAPAEKKAEDIRNVDVVTKYNVAADIANNAIKSVMKACKPGSSVVDLCEAGDKFILEATGKVYNKGKTQKGLGFPTCVSVNNTVGSFSPLRKDDTKIADGDLVKVECGVHIDGYLVLAAHTFVVAAGPVTGRQADVIAATTIAADCILRLLKPGTKNTEITKVIEKVAKDFNCSTVENIFSHQLHRFEIDTESVIANNIPDIPLTGDQKTKEVKIDVNQVWTVDVALSTGSGKPNPVDERTTVFKRAQDTTYNLKMKTSRAVFSEINNRFPIFPFTIRALETEETKAKLGIMECFKHQLVEAYPVVYEKDGEFVANIKFTALVLPDRTLKISGLPFDLSNVKSSLSVKDESVKAVLKTSVAKKKKKSGNKKKKPSAAKTAAAAAAASAPAAAAAAAPAPASSASESKASPKVAAQPAPKATPSKEKAASSASTSSPKSTPKQTPAKAEASPKPSTTPAPAPAPAAAASSPAPAADAPKAKGSSGKAKKASN